MKTSILITAMALALVAGCSSNSSKSNNPEFDGDPGFTNPNGPEREDGAPIEPIMPPMPNLPAPEDTPVDDPDFGWGKDNQMGDISNVQLKRVYDEESGDFNVVLVGEHGRTLETELIWHTAKNGDAHSISGDVVIGETTYRIDATFEYWRSWNGTHDYFSFTGKNGGEWAIIVEKGGNANEFVSEIYMTKWPDMSKVTISKRDMRDFLEANINGKPLTKSQRMQLRKKAQQMKKQLQKRRS